MDLYEQMDIFELLDTCFRTSMQTALPVMEDKAEDMQEEMSSYLRREEKILSIARERMKRMESGCCITEDGQGCAEVYKRDRTGAGEDSGIEKADRYPGRDRSDRRGRNPSRGISVGLW